MNKITTISKKVSGGNDDLIVIPRKEYERLLNAKKVVEFSATGAERSVLSRARSNYQKGNFLTIDELKKKLDLTN